jgi:hypothetical protein
MLSSVLLALEPPSLLPFSKATGAPAVLTCGGGSCRAFLAEDPVSMYVPFELDALSGGGRDGRRKHGTGFHQGSRKIIA